MTSTLTGIGSKAAAWAVALIALTAGAARAQDFSGTYASNWGELRIAQTENGITGTYARGPQGNTGQITGELRQSGGTRYVWGEYRDSTCADANGCRGTIQLRFLHYPDTSDMEFKYMPSWSSSWSTLYAKRPTGEGPYAGTDPARQPPDRPATDATGALKDKPLGGDAHPPERIVVPGGDAGTNNAEAAAIRYHCRIEGALANGDYDAYAFEFAGGDFLAESASTLNLVADLIRASDGEVVARSGVDTPQFRIKGPLAAGRYILQVRVMHHAGAGPYTVTLGQPGACIVEETALPSTVPDATLGLQVEPGSGTFANIGVRVVAVTRGGHAERAGVRTGDVILSIASQPTRGVMDAQGFRLAPGRTATVVLVRNDRVMSLDVSMPAR